MFNAFLPHETFAKLILKYFKLFSVYVHIHYLAPLPGVLLNFF